MLPPDDSQCRCLAASCPLFPPPAQQIPIGLGVGQRQAVFRFQSTWATAQPSCLSGLLEEGGHLRGSERVVLPGSHEGPNWTPSFLQKETNAQRKVTCPGYYPGLVSSCVPPGIAWAGLSSVLTLSYALSAISDSSQPPREVNTITIVHLTEGETEAWRGDRPCPRAHKLYVAQPRFEVAIPASEPMFLTARL